MNIAAGIYIVIIVIAFLFVIIGSLPVLTRTNDNTIDEDKIIQDIINRNRR